MFDMYFFEQGSFDILKDEFLFFLFQVEIVLKNYEKLNEIKKDLDGFYREFDMNRVEL